MVIGPHHSDFQDTMDALLEADGIIVTTEPGSVAGELLNDRNRCEQLVRHGREVILAHQGATKRHATILQEMMPKQD